MILFGCLSSKLQSWLMPSLVFAAWVLWGSRGFPAWGRHALVLGPSLPALTFPMQQLTIELVGLSFLSRDMCPLPYWSVAVAQVYGEERNSP